MLAWIKTFILPPRPLGSPLLFETFNHEVAPLRQDLSPVPGTRSEWCLKCRAPEIVSLFEIENPRIEGCLLTYRAEMRSEGLRSSACLELSCHFPDEAPLIRLGWHHLLSGDQNWEYYELTQRLRPGQRPDQVLLSLAIEGPGTIWLKNVQVIVTPEL